MIIDSHQHVFWLNRDDAGLVADLDEQKIDIAWLLTWEVSFMEERESKLDWYGTLNPLNARPDGTHQGVTLGDLILARDRYPDRFILGYCPHPAIGNAPGLFEAAHRIHGVRVCGEFKYRVLIDDPRCLELFRTAGKLGAPIVLHLDVPYLNDEEGNSAYVPRWYGGTALNLERALQACPETNFIGHAPGFWREISGGADTDPGSRPRGPVREGGRLYRLFDEYPNLFADLSATSCLNALQRDPDHARDFLIRFADRLLFGRDQYGPDHQDFLTTLDLSEEVRHKLFFANANRLVPVGRHVLNH